MGLPGDIFPDSDEKGLDRNELFKYIMYLDEKIQRGLPIEEELACQAVKLRLLKRLGELIRAQIAHIEKSKSE